MQATRFGAFTPAQQARLDQLTGGQDLRATILQALQPMSPQETQDFDAMAADIKGQMWPLKWLSPSQAEVLGKSQLEPFLDGRAQKGLMDELAKTPDPAKQRKILRDSAASAVGVVEFMSQWSKVPTDKTFDALEKMVELMKTTLKF